MLKIPGSNPTKTLDFFVILREQVCSMMNIGEGNLYVTCIKGFDGGYPINGKPGIKHLLYSRTLCKIWKTVIKKLLLGFSPTNNLIWDVKVHNQISPNNSAVYCHCSVFSVTLCSSGYKSKFKPRMYLLDLLTRSISMAIHSNFLQVSVTLQ